MKILLLGRTGQLSRELQFYLPFLGSLDVMGRELVDFTDTRAIEAVITHKRPDVVINAVGYNFVDKAEEEPELAYQINAVAVEKIAKAVEKIGALLVHYSTDYVFDGHKSSPYSEEDKPNPLNVYGASKLVGEQAVQDSGCDHLIFRISWVFSPYGTNFMKTILRVLQEKGSARVVSDQVGSPTGAHLISYATSLALRQIFLSQGNASKFSGIYNLVSSRYMSWFDFANSLKDKGLLLGLLKDNKAYEVIPISSGDYPARAQRPLNSRLDISKFETIFGLSLPAWDWQIDSYLKELFLINL